ncbi:MAG: hypothetical protein AAF694_03530 [Bacteroidota bacterium]
MEIAHNRNELSPQGAQDLAEILDRLLSDVQVYHQNIRTLSWDQGLKPFLLLSSSLGQLDQMVHNGENILADQILSLGHTPTSQPSTLLYKTNIQPIEEVMGFDHAIMTLVSGSRQLLETIQDVFDKAVDLEEPHTMNLMSQVAKQVSWNISFFTQMRLAQWN